MRPLDFLSSIKAKLGVVIVAAVAVTVVVVLVGLRAGAPPVVLGVAAGLLALGMVQFLARGMTSPLREMAAAARAMAKGDYGRTVTATSRDEVGELARAFNKMASELAETDKVRRDLIANVSHDLRTPLGALQAVLENLVDGVEPADPHTLRTMLEQVQRLGRLVSQLLELSRLESGVVPLEAKSFPLRPLVDQAIRETKLRAGDINVRMDIEPGDLAARGDPEKVHQVLANLLQNAVRHSPIRGEVFVGARRDGQQAVVIEVRDQGPGIPPEERARVFQRFYRSDASRSADDAGSGLGLAITRWIVDLHGGDIRAEQAQPTGCRMVVRLPSG